MSFGGSVSAMISTLKNNARPRAAGYKKLKKFLRENDVQKKQTFVRPLTEEERRLIRERTRAAYAKSRRREVWMFMISLLILTAVILGIVFLIDSIFISPGNSLLSE